MWLSRALLLLAWLAATPIHAWQDPPAIAETTHSDFFSGIVEELPAGKVTVSRTALGKSENRSFLIKSSTKIEGKLRTKARVTVRRHGYAFMCSPFPTRSIGASAIHF